MCRLSIDQWGNEEVAAWLESLHLAEYRDDFISHDIRGPELLTLERRDLKELGIHKVWFLPSPVNLPRLFLVFTGFNWVLLRFMGLYGVLLGFP